MWRPTPKWLYYIPSLCSARELQTIHGALRCQEHHSVSGPHWRSVVNHVRVLFALLTTRSEPHYYVAAIVSAVSIIQTYCRHEWIRRTVVNCGLRQKLDSQTFRQQAKWLELYFWPTAGFTEWDERLLTLGNQKLDGQTVQQQVKCLKLYSELLHSLINAANIILAEET